MATKPETEAPEATPSVAELMARLEAQSLEIERLKAQGPQFTPMRRDPVPREGGYKPPEQLEGRLKNLVRQSGDEANGRASWYDDPKYTADLPKQYRPVFQSGNLVRLNPDVIPHGHTKTYREIYGDKVATVGEILSNMGRTSTFEPKYKVLIQGVSSRYGDGIRESELLPA